MKFKCRELLSCSALLLLALAGCGGSGGSGSSFTGSANVSISAQPGSVDPGDRVLVTVEVDSIHPSGVAVKLRYPTAFSYVQGTSQLEIDGQTALLNPDFEEPSTSGRYVFLVYLLTQPQFIAQGGRITLQLRADSSITDGELAVDADVDTGEFDPNVPEFAVQDSVLVTVSNEN